MTSFQIVQMTMSQCGFGPEFNGPIPGYSGTEGSPWLVHRDESYVFDCTEAMRVMYLVWTREISRPDHRHRKGLFLHGPTGCGKTSFIEQFFARINVPLIRTTWNPQREAEELVSTNTLVDGDILPKNQAIAKAAQLGIPVLINEIDLAQPGELMALADVIEKGLISRPDGSTFIAERGFIVFATGNTAGNGDDTGLYADTRSQNCALMRRFFHLEMGYPSEENELSFLRETFPAANDALLQNSARVIAMIRQAYDGTASRERLSSPISRPEAIDWVEMMLRSSGLTEKGVNVASFAMNLAFSARLTDADKMTVDTIVENCFGH